ncbi:MAG: hypothetical protein ACKOZW_01195 [Cyanobium sp.]
MIVLKITNSSEFLASKIGKFLEGLTPDGFDATTVEDILLRKLIENLAAEGLRGEVAAVHGLDLEQRPEGAELVLHEKMRIRHHESF